jgi:tight adherence protein C
LSRTERAAHLMAMEEKAAKLPPKMTLPMMLFILPTVVLIAAGPAILTLSSVFGKMHP